MHLSECLVLDASCLLNLYATGRLREIALAVGVQVEVADYVLEREAIYYLADGFDGRSGRGGSRGPDSIGGRRTY